MQEDQKIKAADEDYLARHQIKDLMAAMLQEVVMRKPLDPVQYLVDYLTLDPSLAAQDENGVSAYRRARLLEVFKVMDDGDGKVNFKECQGFTGKHGGKVLSETELSATSATTRRWMRSSTRTSSCASSAASCGRWATQRSTR